MAKPIILITGPEIGGLPAYFCTAYRVYKAGGKAIRLHSGIYDPNNVPAFDALIVGGGADISESPELSDSEFTSNHRTSLFKRVILELFSAIFTFQAIIRGTKSFSWGDTKRNIMETQLLTLALKKQTPVLGICRGAQLLNSVHGGSLYGDLSSFYVETVAPFSIFARKYVDIKPDSLLAKILETNSCKVNALHRQAIDKTGKGLEISATEDNGIVQAVEDPNKKFIIGVQWHPEYLFFNKTQAKLFKYMVSSVEG